MVCLQSHDWLPRINRILLAKHFVTTASRDLLPGRRQSIGAV